VGCTNSLLFVLNIDCSEQLSVNLFGSSKIIVSISYYWG
jgi:hypothetical protein